MAFDHEKLDVYQLAIEFVANAKDIIELLPRGRGYLADQLQRAALSIVFIASATESAAVLDNKVVAQMLTKLIKIQTSHRMTHPCPRPSPV
jgi:hypothetical protein